MAVDLEFLASHRASGKESRVVYVKCPLLKPEWFYSAGCSVKGMQKVEDSFFLSITVS